MYHVKYYLSQISFRICEHNHHHHEGRQEGKNVAQSLCGVHHRQLVVHQLRRVLWRRS